MNKKMPKKYKIKEIHMSTRVKAVIIILSIALFTSLLLILILSSKHVYIPSIGNKVSSNFSIGVTTDHNKYVTGQPILIKGTIDNSNNNSKPEFVTITLSFIDANISNPIFQKIINTSGSFSTGKEDLRIEDPGDYLVHAFVNDKKVDAYNLIHVEESFFSLPALFMFGTFAAIGMLLLVIIIDTKKSTYLIELLRFSCITAIVILPIFGFFTADLEMGSTSTMGLIREPPQENNKARIMHNGTIFPGGEWKFNIGGLPEDNYNNGLQIPVYVIIFGLL
jgi:hypothetical protein